MEKINIYCTTSDNYHHALKVFCYTFNKFWGEDWNVTVLGYSTPKFDLPNNFSFESLGVQTGPKDWSNDLRKYFSQVNDEYFIYIMEDQFLTRNVNFDILKVLLKLKEEKDIVRIDLTDDMVVNHSGIYKGAEPYRVVDGVNVVKLDIRSEYKINTQASIWPTAKFLEYLKPNFTPWEFEYINSEHVQNDDVLVLGTLKEEGVFLDRIEGVRITSVNSLNLHGLDFETINELREKEII